MGYQGDHATRTMERVSSWAWAGRLSPRWVMVLAAGWLLLVVILSVFLILRNAEVESHLVILLFAPINLLGVAGLGSGQGDVPLDEWQRAMRNKAFMWGGNLTLGMVGLWVAFAMGLAENSWFWTPDTENDWTILFLLLVTCWMSLTTIAAARLTPSYAADIDEYE